MKQFDLSLWLQDKSRKVATRDGRPVRIVCWDAKNSKPIIALVLTRSVSQRLFDELPVSYFNDGTYYGRTTEDLLDLFFADEEQQSKELTEFEIGVLDFADEWEDAEIDSKILNNLLKKHSKILIDLARKELLKDLPKWKKTVQDYYHQGNIPCTNPTISGDEEYLIVGAYEIKISDLETLPKEEF